MANINYSISINAAPEAVFAIIADVESQPERITWYENVEMLTEGPVGVGTKWRETRRMNKRQSFEEWEMKVFESPNFFSAYCDSHDYDIDWTMRVEPEGSGCKLTLGMNSRPRKLIGKLMIPVEWLLVGMMKSMVRKDLESTKAYIEKKLSR